MSNDDALRRASLVLQLRSMGITDHRLVSAFESTPREQFTPTDYANDAYADRLVPIACGQIMEAPGVLARLLHAVPVQDSMSVLEIGTGSGYLTALLAKLARRVISLERYRTLVDRARTTLDAQGLRNVEVVLADGLSGWAGAAPYQAIFVSGSVQAPPAAWGEQLAPGGTLVAPIGAGPTQTWVGYTKAADGSWTQQPLGRAFTVPLQAGLARTM